MIILLSIRKKFAALSRLRIARLHILSGFEAADRKTRQNSYYDALNTCIEHSTGDILTVLAGDDERGGPYVLEHVADEFEKHGPGPFCLYGACEWVNHEASILAYKQPPVLPVTFDVILKTSRFIRRPCSGTEPSTINSACTIPNILGVPI